VGFALVFYLHCTLISHMVILYLIFKDCPCSFRQWMHHFTSSLTVHKDLILHVLVNTCYS
jgi:hypothetical protein